jgi:cysteine sulfinate desulfinase/cysteine desulfurase-like protein
VALAYGLSYENAKSCVRLSLSIESTAQEVELFLHEFAILMAEYGIYGGHKLETA